MFGRALRNVRPVHVAAAGGAAVFALNQLEVQHRSPAYAAASTAAAIDSRGASTQLTAPGGMPMSLAGVGMRRKNLYVMEVDVYLVSCYLNDSAMRAGKESEDGDDLPKKLLSSAKSQRDGPLVAINSKFVRDVGKDKIVESFNEAFKGCDENAVAKLKSHLGSVIGDNGMKKGEEFQFYWYGQPSKKGLVIVKNGTVCETEATDDMQALQERLLNVYIGPNTVSPELKKSLKDQLD